MKRTSIFLFTIILAGAFSFSGCSKPAKNSSGNYPVRGPENAALKIEQFSDFHCSFCKAQAQVLKQVMDTYPGKIRWAFRHLPILGEPGSGSFPVHEASMCANEQGKFWEFHDAAFELDSKAEIPQIIHGLNLNQEKFDACFNSNRYRPMILADIEEAKKRKVSGTPTFFINGEMVAGLRPFEYFAELIDPEFAQKAQAERKKVREELLKRIDQSETGRPAAGPENAPVTITEFSDFHCPYCVKLTATLKQVMENYPQTVHRVWRHFPLPIHPQSAYAHLASECAHAQGKFWEFHQAVFADQKAAHSRPDLEKIAESLGLNIDQFKTCYEAPETKKKIENDVLLGMYQHVGSTPTFFVNGEMFIGAKSAEDLKKIIDRKLAEVQKEPAGK